MPRFELPPDLTFNRGAIEDPTDYAREDGCASWLHLCGEEFEAMGGISYAQVQASVDRSANIVSDPPKVLDLDLARQHVAALDELPRPTLISCRTGPRASAVAYMYAGLKQGSDPEDVLVAADRDNAPFTTFDAYREWVVAAMRALADES